MTAHSKLPPSSAARRVQCPGSRIMSERYPQDENDPKAREGTEAHLVVAAHLRAEPTPAFATEEMLDGADMFHDALRGNIPHIEERVDCSSIHPDCWGTPDAWYFYPKRKWLHVLDYKFGRRHVEVFENWQLLEYAAGIIANFPLEVLGVSLTIVQPRSYHKDGPVRTWNLNRLEFIGYVISLKEAEDLATRDMPECKTGPECRDCPARHACPTLQSSGYSAAKSSGEAISFELSPAAMGKELAMLRDSIMLMSARADGLENEALVKAKQGVAVPGWTTEQGQGREKWAKPVEEVISLGEMLGIDVSKPGVVTPKQAIKKGLSEDVVRAYSETPPGEVKLVRDNGSMARKWFNT
jgi:hypothetical protein